MRVAKRRVEAHFETVDRVALVEVIASHCRECRRQRAISAEQDGLRFKGGLLTSNHVGREPVAVKALSRTPVKTTPNGVDVVVRARGRKVALGLDDVDLAGSGPCTVDRVARHHPNWKGKE